MRAYFGFDTAATLGRDSVSGGTLALSGTGASFVSVGYGGVGGALSLSGKTYYTSLFSANLNLPIGNSPYTIVLLVKMPLACNRCGFVGWGTYKNSNQVNAFRTNDNRLNNYWWNNDLISVSATNQFDGNWHQVAVTYDGTTRRIYFDKVQSGSDTPAAGSHNVPAGTVFTLGGTDIGNNNEYFVGIMDHVVIYSTALTLAQLTTLSLGGLL